MADYPTYRHVIVDNDNPLHPHCKGVGDLDGDGHPDLLAASAAGGGLFWYRYPDWTKHRIAEGTFTTDIAVADIDGDGHQDIIIPSDKGLMWYRNPRVHGDDPAAGPWEAINISPAGEQMHDIQIGDLDGDGQLEIVTRRQSEFGIMLGNTIHIWKRDTFTAWQHRILTCPHGEGLELADIDGDGRPDIVIGGRWYRNPGDILSGEWTEQLYVDPAYFDEHWTRGNVAVRAGDMNGDGRLEIVLSPAEGKGHFSWFERTAASWREHVIEPNMDHAHGLALADMDGDGRLDIVIAKMHQASAPQEVAIYHNLGRGQSWEKQVVSTQGSHNIRLVNFGGHIGIFGANWHDNSPTHGACELWLP